MEMMMMKKSWSRSTESTFSAATHIGSVRLHAGNLVTSEEAEGGDFDNDALLCTVDADLEAAAKRLSPGEFFELVNSSQRMALTSAIEELNHSLSTSQVESSLLLPPLRRLSSIHRLPVAGLSEQQRSHIRSTLSDCLATQAEGRSPSFLTGWLDVALTTAQRSLPNGLVDRYGDIRSPNDYELLCLTLTLCQNYTDSDESGKLSVALATEGNALIRLCREFLAALADNHLAGQLHDSVEQLLRQCISVPYNLYFKQVPKVTSALSEHKLVRTAKPYLSSPDEDVRLAAYLLLAFACTESQASSCLAETRLIELLINRMRLALQARDRRCQGYHCVELAKCALRMARNDANKEQLVDNGLLTLLTDMMSGGRSDEQLVAMETALCLSFSPACVPRLREQCRAGFNTIRRLVTSSSVSSEAANALYQIIEALDFNLDGQPAESLLSSRLLSSRCLATKQIGHDSDSQEEDDERNAANAAFNEKQSEIGQQPKARPKTAIENGHVMISYHRATNRDLADWLNDRLKETGHTVWLDEDSMQGSTLECMAKAVESASVVLICLSRGYKDSNSCRMEAEYASRRGKPIVTLQAEPRYTPDGWLGILTGSQFLIDFTKPEIWPVSWPRLCRSIPLINKPAGCEQQPQLSSTCGLQVLPQQPPQPPPSHGLQFLPPRQTHERSYTNWSSEQVANWLRLHSLSRHLEPFQLAGEHLNFFIQLRREAPEAFYRLLETQLRLNSFHELYAFVRALESLDNLL